MCGWLYYPRHYLICTECIKESSQTNNNHSLFPFAGDISCTPHQDAFLFNMCLFQQVFKLHRILVETLSHKYTWSILSWGTCCCCVPEAEVMAKICLQKSSSDCGMFWKSLPWYQWLKILARERENRRRENREREWETWREKQTELT